MTETVFAKLFYDILLRVNFAEMTQPIFKCFEVSFWFINIHLKNIELSFLGKLTLLPNRRVVGLEALIHIYALSKNKDVKNLSKKQIFEVLKAELNTGKQLSKVASEDIIIPCREIIEREYAELAVKLDRVQVIVDCFILIKDVVQFIGGSEESSSISKLNIGITTGPYEPADGSNQLKLIIENNTPVTKFKVFDVEISEYATLKQLKKKILEPFVCFTDSDVFMMSKGRILYELDKTLKEQSITNDQRILLFQNEDYERDAEGEMLKSKEAKILQVAEILPEIPNDLISLALTRNGDDVTLAVAFLSEGSGEILAEELKEIQRHKEDYTKTGGNPGRSLERKTDIKSFLSFLANYTELYELIFQMMRLGNNSLEEVLWDLLLALPLSEETKSEIAKVAQGNQYGMDVEFDANPQESAFELSTLLSNPTSSKCCYKLHVLSKILNEGFNEPTLEWLLFEGNLLLLASSLQGDDIKKLDGTIECSLKERKASLRYLSSLLEVMKVINNKFVNPQALKVKLLYNDSIYGMLLKDCENNLPAPANQKHDYFDMYAQVINESSFNTLICGLMANLLRRCAILDESELIFLRNIFEFCFEFSDREKAFETLTMLAESVCTQALPAGPGLTLLNNIILYYSCLHNMELDLVSNLKTKFAMIERIEGMSSILEELEPIKVRIELIGQLLSLMERKKFRSNEKWPEIKTTLLQIISQMRAIFELVVGRGVVNEQMWQSFHTQAESSEVQSHINYFKKANSTTNELCLLMKQSLSFFISISLKLDEESEIFEFYQNFVMKILLGCLKNQKTFLTLLALQSDNRIRMNLQDMALAIAGINYQYALGFLLELSKLFKEEDFKTSPWNYVDMRKPGTYIGIKNLGSTCYANSLFQQLYHNQRIREFLLNLETSGVGVIHEMKQVFIQLDRGLISQSDLTSFTQSFHGFEGQPINVRVQQDVNEFFNLLLDIIESELKEQKFKGKDMFHAELGGNLHNEIVGLEKEYEYEACNQEHYNTLSLDVKGTGTINEALDKYFQPVIFEGDNKLYCEKYDKKITVKKNTWLSSQLPQTLVLMLKRFEYDNKTYTRFKLNDYFEFPLELNMKKWVKLPEDESLSLIDEPANFTYKLKGVLVHSGTSEFGHYYSFIFSNGKWIEFNDTKVSEFSPTPENLKKEWFGADVEEGFFNFSQNSKSAYMLFYEKAAQPEEGRKVEAEHNEVSQALMLENLNKLNEAFLHAKAYNDLGHLRFMNDLLTKMDTEEGIEKLLDILVEKGPETSKEKNEGIDQGMINDELENLSPGKHLNNEANILDVLNLGEDKMTLDITASANQVSEVKNDDEKRKGEGIVNELQSKKSGNKEQSLSRISEQKEPKDKIKPGEGELLHAFLRNLKVGHFDCRVLCWPNSRAGAML